MSRTDDVEGRTVCCCLITALVVYTVTYAYVALNQRFDPRAHGNTYQHQVQETRLPDGSTQHIEVETVVPPVRKDFM